MRDAAGRAVGALRAALLDAWNRRDAAAYAACFADAGAPVGFDGSETRGRDELAATLGRIFADHATATDVSIVREVRPLGGDAILLRAVAGMVPPGGRDLNPPSTPSSRSWPPAATIAGGSSRSTTPRPPSTSVRRPGRRSPPGSAPPSGAWPGRRVRPDRRRLTHYRYIRRR